MEEARPFFLLDWLDDLMIDQDAFQIAELLKTPSKLPRQQNLVGYSSHNHVSMIEIPLKEESEDIDGPSSSISSSMLRSISSPDVCWTPRSSNCKRSPSRNGHDILPTRLFHHSNENDCSDSDIHSYSDGKDQSHHIQEETLSVVRTPSRNTIAKTKPTTPSGIFKKRSMALGNGWNAKGLTKAKQGRWDAALACWDNALDIRLQISDPRYAKDQLEVANTWNNRGIALGKLGQYHNAIQALQEAYQIRNVLLGEGHQQVVSTLHNIANVHQQQGDLTTALQVFGKAKNLLAKSSSSTTGGSKKITNTDPMLLARICTAIGHIYYQAQQWVDSRDAYQDALNLLLQQSSSEDASKLSQSSEQQWQREIYELQRDIQEINGKISILHHTASFLTMGSTGPPPFYHGHGHRPHHLRQSPQR